jgi:CheY-like chemotaxis protein
MADIEQSRKRIMFVDDDVSFLDMLTKVFCAWSKETWEIVSASNTGKAIAILQEKPVDLVVIDLHMPGVDGLQFLRLLHRKYPNIPKVVLTGDPSEELKKVCLDNGAEFYMTKPTSIEGMESIFATLQELSKWQSDEGFRGMMRRIGLQEILQLECLNRNSSVLEITANRLRGHVYIKVGQIIHAQIGESKGEAAFYQMMALRAGDFNLQPYAEPTETTIDASWEHLLMEGARLRDEGGGESVPATHSVVGAEDPDVAASESQSENLKVEAQFDPEAIAAARDQFAPKVEEMLVVSGKGEVLYENQSATEERLTLVNFLSERSREIVKSLPLGRFTGLEVSVANNRLLVHSQMDNWVVIKIARGTGGRS